MKQILLPLLGMMLLMLVGGYQIEAQDAQENASSAYGVLIEPLEQGGTESAICVVNMKEQEPYWFLLALMGNTQIGTISAALHQIADIKASSDGKYLAVLSVGEGHPILEVIELPTLLTQKTYTVLHTIDPYPGTIDIRSWKGMRLHVGSDMLLTHQENPNERVPSELMLATPEIFALSMVTGEISGISEGAKNPVMHYAKVLEDPRASNREKENALSFILGLDSADISIADLTGVLEQEQDPKRILKLLEKIEQLRQQQGKSAGTMLQ